MNTIGSFERGIVGIKRGLNSANTQAAEIASADALIHPPEKDLAQPLVYMITARSQVEASAKVVKTTDAMLGALLDIKA
ncbi:MAG: hypothetical protein HY940_08955 [Gammaproteobacteria bacterium]|nr:hypothetical protein [Gammaproteobacteria bacterium]